MANGLYVVRNVKQACRPVDPDGWPRSRHGEDRFANEETGEEVFSSPQIPISFAGKDPAGQYGVTFRFSDCRFPAPGVYVIQFWFNDTLVQEQPLVVR